MAQTSDSAARRIVPIADVHTACYLRLRVQDRPGVLADVTRILSDGDISIEAMLQRAPAEGESETDIVILTHVALERPGISESLREIPWS